MEGMNQDSVTLDNLLIVSEGPHIRSNQTVRRTMLNHTIGME